MRIFSEEEKSLIAFIQELGIKAFIDPLVKLPGTSEALWKACVRTNIFSTGRDSEVELQVSSVGGTLFDDSIVDTTSTNVAAARLKRFVVLEAAMSAGLGALVGEYIVAQGPVRTATQEFLLPDVGTVFVWARDMYKATADETFRVIHLVAAPALVHKHSHLCERPVINLNPLTIAEARDKLDEYMVLCTGLLCVLDRLLTRKVMTFSASVGEGMDVGADARSEHDNAVADLEQLSIEVATLLGILRVVSVALAHDTLHLGHLSPGCSPEWSLATAKQNRLVTSTAMEFLPESLRVASDQLLYDVIFSRLPAKLHASASMIASGLDYKALYEHLANFLWLPMSCARDLTDHGSLNKGTKTLVRNERQKASATLGQALVITLFLDAHLLNKKLVGSSSTRGVSSECEALAADLANAYDMGPGDRMRLLALWRIDVQLDLTDAVRDCCDASVALFGDTELFLAAALRLLAAGKCHHAKQLLQHSSVSSELMHSQTGILAFTAASLDKDVWKFTWHAARGLCRHLSSSAAVAAKKAVASLLCQWALFSGELGALLEAVMDDDERGQVRLILDGLAQREMEGAALPAHAVDTLIMWLLRLRRIDEAKTLHEQHCLSLGSRTRDAEFVQRFGDVEARALLISSYAVFSSVPRRELKGVPGRATVGPLPTPGQSYLPTGYHLAFSNRTQEVAASASGAMEVTTTALDGSFVDRGFNASRHVEDDSIPANTSAWSARSPARPVINLDLDEDEAAETGAMDTQAEGAGAGAGAGSAPVPVERIVFAADGMSSSSRSRIASLLQPPSASSSRGLPTPPSSTTITTVERRSDWNSSYEQSPLNLSQIPNPNEFREELYSPAVGLSSDQPQATVPLPFNSAAKRFALSSLSKAPAGLHSGAFMNTQSITTSEMRGNFGRFDPDDSSPLTSTRRKVRFSEG